MKREKTTRERRTRIMNAAMLCFLESGYHQTGVRDIAKRAGVSLGNLYNHFPGKHDILVEIAALERSELQPFLDLLARPDPASSILDQFVADYGQYLAKPENVILTIEILSEAIRKPDIGALFMENRDALVSALATVVQRGVDDGDFRKALASDDAAHFMIDLIEASAYRAVLGEEPMSQLLESVKDFITAALRP